MGFGWQELLIILVIVALIFGTKKLRSIGSDLGGAVKGFKDGIASDSASDDSKEASEGANKETSEKKDASE